MMTRPPAGIASRALIARLRRTSSSWCGSTKAGQRSPARAVITSTVPPNERRSRSWVPATSSFKSTGFGARCCLREKASSCSLSLAPCRADRAAACTSFSSGSSGRRISSSSRLPRIAASKLLKSCASPETSWPMASIFSGGRLGGRFVKRACRRPLPGAAGRVLFLHRIAQLVEPRSDLFDRGFGLCFEADQLVPRLAVHPDQLVELQLDRLGVAPLRVLDHEDHDKRDDRRGRVDDQLPAVRPAVEGTRSKPQPDEDDGRKSRARSRHLLLAPARKAGKRPGGLNRRRVVTHVDLGEICLSLNDRAVAEFGGSS